MPLALSIRKGIYTKHRTKGFYTIYKVTELLKIHVKFSGVPVEMLICMNFFLAMCDLCYFVLPVVSWHPMWYLFPTSLSLFSPGFFFVCGTPPSVIFT